MNLELLRGFALDNKLDFSLDSMDQIGMLKKWPELWEMACDILLPSFSKNYREIVFLGMGGSAIAGDYVKSAYGTTGARFIVHKNYGLPHEISSTDETLVIASSYSGNTEETLSGASAAIQQGYDIVGMSTGGKLRDLLVEHDLPYLSLPTGLVPRASLGVMFPLLARVVEQATGAKSQINRSFSSRLAEISKGEPSQFALALAEKLESSLPVILGVEHTAPLALRMRAQLNENAKKHAMAFEIPEHNHNAIVPIGIDQAYPTHFVLVIDRHHTSSRNLRRVDFLNSFLSRLGENYSILELPKGASIAQSMVELTYRLDFVSIYIALLRKIDPNPVDSIAELKSFLTRA